MTSLISDKYTFIDAEISEANSKYNHLAQLVERGASKVELGDLCLEHFMFFLQRAVIDGKERLFQILLQLIDTESVNHLDVDWRLLVNLLVPGVYNIFRAENGYQSFLHLIMHPCCILDLKSMKNILKGLQKFLDWEEHCKRRNVTGRERKLVLPSALFFKCQAHCVRLLGILSLRYHKSNEFVIAQALVGTEPLIKLFAQFKVVIFLLTVREDWDSPLSLFRTGLADVFSHIIIPSILLPINKTLY